MDLKFKEALIKSTIHILIKFQTLQVTLVARSPISQVGFPCCV